MTFSRRFDSFTQIEDDLVVVERQHIGLYRNKKKSFKKFGIKFESLQSSSRLEMNACKKFYLNLECMKRSWLKADTKIPMEVVRASKDDWIKRFLDCR